MPSEDQVPAGPHRQLLLALHRAYAAAGRPGLRQISLGLKLDDSAPATLNYQAIGKILNGKQIPTPRQLASLALWLFREGSFGGQSEEDSKDFVKQLMTWREATHSQQYQTSDSSGSPTEHEDRTAEPRSDPRLPRDEIKSANERNVLSCMLQSKDAIADVVEILKVEDFTDTLHREIYLALLDLYGNHLDISIKSVHAKLRTDASTHIRTMDYLSDLLGELDTFEEAERYAEIVSNRSAVRRVVALGHKVAKMAQSIADEEDPDVETLVDLVEDEVFSFIEERGTIGGLALEAAIDEIETAGEARLNGVASGFQDYDLLTSGFRAGELVIAAGASAMGKSTLGLNFIRSCSLRHSSTSFLVSLQMSRDDMTMRLFSAEGRVAMHHMRSGSMTDDDWTRLAEVVPAIGEAPIHMVDEPGFTIDRLTRACKRLRILNDLRLIVVDSIDLLYVDPENSTGDPERDMFLIARELRKMAKELSLPVVALYQMGRLPERRTDHAPTLREIPGSLESLADLVILLHREDAYEKESVRAGEADLIIAKNRNGPTGTITVAFQGHYARFVDMSGT